MGNSAPQTDARSLREELVGLDVVHQHIAAYQWAINNGRAIDVFGEFAKERNLRVFQSGNECENWIDTILNVVYKMNTLVHTGDNILKLLDRIEWYNTLFPTTALHFVGIQIMSSTHVYPVFSQPFVSSCRLATEQEITEYMTMRGFIRQEQDGVFASKDFLLSDIKPKNVLIEPDGTIFVIDAEIERLNQ
ncbi:MAG: hypothetical protein IJU36_01485 [Paludibacteraceae bacterium]|nr:hypothetical protein [Paludibacteraceae bacterium]